jgi:uncharacterized protein
LRLLLSWLILRDEVKVTFQEAKPVGYTPNPFTNRGVITNEEDFIGREEQIGEIIGRLRTLQSSSVVGERRIGKSSLLFHLTQIGARRIEDGSYRFFYLDLQNARFHTAAGFFRATLNALGVAPDTIQSTINDGQSLNRNLIAFTDQIEAMQQRGERIVLCLDEFEIIFKHRDQFPEDFFDHIRSMLNIRTLAFVTASRKTLETHSLEGKLTSPFYNLFTVVELNEFTEAEAQQFLDTYHQRVNFTDDEIEFIISYLDPHPMKLQILCDWLMKNRQKKLADWALVEEIARDHGNFFIGTFEAKNLRRVKKMFSVDNIKKLFEMIKAGRELFSESKEK